MESPEPEIIRARHTIADFRVFLEKQLEHFPNDIIREKFVKYIRDDNLVEYLRQCIYTAYEQGLREMNWSRYLGEKIDDMFNYLDEIEAKKLPDSISSTKLRCRDARKSTTPRRRRDPTHIPLKEGPIRIAQSEISEEEFYFPLGGKIQ